MYIKLSKYFKMVSVTDGIQKVIAFALIPYLIMVLLTIIFFVHQKCRISRQIQKLQDHSNFRIDLETVKKNLQIKSLIHSFVLLIYCYEAVMCILWSISSIYFKYLSPGNSTQQHKPLNTSASCINRDNGIHMFSLFLALAHYILVAMPALINLFLIVLRRAYLNAPYTFWYKRFAIYIIARISIPSLMSQFTVSRYFVEFFVLPFTILDFYAYVKLSRNFYLLLKGLSTEAKFHSTPEDYRRKERIAKVFHVTRNLTLLVFGVGVIMCLMNSIIAFANSVQYSKCIFQYAFPNVPVSFTVPGRLDEICKLVREYCSIIVNIGSIILITMVSLSGLVIFVSIIMILLRRKQVIINDLETSLLNNYD